MSLPRIMIVGLGNPILGDDGIGWKIAEEVEKSLANNLDHANLKIDSLAIGGISLMESLVGFDFAILIDAVQTSTRPLGSIVQFTLDELPNEWLGHTGSPHDMNLSTAIELGSKMGFNLPDKIYIVGIEANAIYDFSDELSPPIRGAIPEATLTVLNLIETLEAQR
jgi:hydrogenase maturation protease